MTRDHIEANDKNVDGLVESVTRLPRAGAAQLATPTREELLAVAFLLEMRSLRLSLEMLLRRM